MTNGADSAERLTEICAELGGDSTFVNESSRVGEHPRWRHRDRRPFVTELR